MPVAFQHDPRILYEYATRRYFARFWRLTINSAYERLTKGNEIAVRIPDEWHCVLDPRNVGEELGLPLRPSPE